MSIIAPIPDPTLLTTQQLTREIAALKEVIFTRIDGMDLAIKLANETITRVPSDADKQIQHLKELLEVRIYANEKDHEQIKEILETRLNGMDRALDLLQELSNKLPAKIDEKINSLHQVHDEKFNSIQTQFRERDVRTEQSSKDSKVAVDAALQAAKEAVGEQNKSSALAIAKSETSTMKQIDQIMQLIQNGNKAVDDKIGDVKERLTRIEGRGEGIIKQEGTTQTSNHMLISVIAVLVSMVSIGLAITNYHGH